MSTVNHNFWHMYTIGNSQLEEAYLTIIAHLQVTDNYISSCCKLPVVSDCQKYENGWERVDRVIAIIKTVSFWIRVYVVLCNRWIHSLISARSEMWNNLFTSFDSLYCTFLTSKPHISCIVNTTSLFICDLFVNKVQNKKRKAKRKKNTCTVTYRYYKQVRYRESSMSIQPGHPSVDRRNK